MADTKDILQIDFEGPISEKTDFFSRPLKQASKIVLNLKKMTFINSIGVKNWISWTVRIPTGCLLELHFVPSAMIHQGNTVMGFFPPNTSVESFFCYFICDKCSDESTQLLERGKHYEYATKTTPFRFSIPEDLKCPRCGGTLSPDIIPEKTFKFLEPLSKT